MLVRTSEPRDKRRMRTFGGCPSMERMHGRIAAMAGAGSGIVDAHVHLSLDDGMRMRRAAHGVHEYLADAQEAGIEAAAVLAMPQPVTSSAPAR
jgi:hypothetical protein